MVEDAACTSHLHGKTTMCPEIFKRQLAYGAWGMTFAAARA